MLQLKQKFKRLRAELAGLDVRKKRILISVAVLAILTPIITLGSWAVNTTEYEPFLVKPPNTNQSKNNTNKKETPAQAAARRGEQLNQFWAKELAKAAKSTDKPKAGSDKAYIKNMAKNIQKNRTNNPTIQKEFANQGIKVELKVLWCDPKEGKEYTETEKNKKSTWERGGCHVMKKVCDKNTKAVKEVRWNKYGKNPENYLENPAMCDKVDACHQTKGPKKGLWRSELEDGYYASPVCNKFCKRTDGTIIYAVWANNNQAPATHYLLQGNEECKAGTDGIKEADVKNHTALKKTVVHNN